MSHPPLEHALQILDGTDWSYSFTADLARIRGRTFVPDDRPASLHAALRRLDDPAVTLAALERAHILATLTRCRGHREQTARALGISDRTLRRKLALYRASPASAPS